MVVIAWTRGRGGRSGRVGASKVGVGGGGLGRGTSVGVGVEVCGLDRVVTGRGFGFVVFADNLLRIYHVRIAHVSIDMA